MSTNGIPSKPKPGTWRHLWYSCLSASTSNQPRTMDYFLRVWSLCPLLSSPLHHKISGSHILPLFLQGSSSWFLLQVCLCLIYPSHWDANDISKMHIWSQHSFTLTLLKTPSRHSEVQGLISDGATLFHSSCTTKFSSHTKIFVLFEKHHILFWLLAFAYAVSSVNFLSLRPTLSLVTPTYLSGIPQLSLPVEASSCSYYSHITLENHITLPEKFLFSHLSLPLITSSLLQAFKKSAM